MVDKTSKPNQLSNEKIEENEESFKKAQEFGISRELHRKILALKIKPDNSSKEMSELIKEIENRIGDKYIHYSDDELRDEYFKYKGYLS